MIETFRRAHEHQGAAIVEIYQNCNVFNDGAFDGIIKRDARAEMMIDLVHGEPITFGADNQRGVVMDRGGARIAEIADVGMDAVAIHDENAPSAAAFALAQLASDRMSPTPFGVFRSVTEPEYAQAVSAQLAAANEQQGAGDLAALLRSGATWEVE